MSDFWDFDAAEEKRERIEQLLYESWWESSEAFRDDEYAGEDDGHYEQVAA